MDFLQVSNVSENGLFLEDASSGVSRGPKWPFWLLLALPSAGRTYRSQKDSNLRHFECPFWAV